jgi:hypothetical protein
MSRLCAGFSQNIGACGLTTGKYSGPCFVSSFGMTGGQVALTFRSAPRLPT